ncbi:MAG: putative sterol carrier protein [Flavobacterium sp.]|jgi:putative sterol carrier protein
MLRQLLLEKKEKLAPNFKAGFLDRPNTIFQFMFEKTDPFFLTVDTEDFEFTPGIHENPTLILNVKDPDTCWGLLEGRIDGMDAFMAGTYRADGNIVLSQLMLYLFKNNDASIAYEVQD